MAKEQQFVLIKQHESAGFEPIGWVHRWTIHFSIARGQARSSLMGRGTRPKTGEFCHWVMYDPLSARVAHSTIRNGERSSVCLTRKRRCWNILSLIAWHNSRYNSTWNYRFLFAMEFWNERPADRLLFSVAFHRHRRRYFFFFFLKLAALEIHRVEINSNHHEEAKLRRRGIDRVSSFINNSPSDPEKRRRTRWKSSRGIRKNSGKRWMNFSTKPSSHETDRCICTYSKKFDSHRAPAWFSVTSRATWRGNERSASLKVKGTS